MKKILLCSAALVGVAAFAAPAMAQVDVTVGGHSKNYVGWFSQDDTLVGAGERHVDMIRESEVHFNAEGTADNGLTYGFHVETEVDGGDSSSVQESYLYLSSNLGRVNLGSEDGAAYLLQVAAPSADANIDGLRQYINPVNTGITGTPGVFDTYMSNDGLDYDQDLTGDSEKLTYLSPNWSGFQFGLSYTPDLGDNGSANPTGAGFGSSPAKALNTSSNGAVLGDAYEGALRYEGTFNNIGFAVGGGYTKVNAEDDSAVFDDETEWNVGADFDIGAFGLGAAYTTTGNLNGTKDLDVDTWVVGGDYTTGPFQFGVSYLDQNFDNAGVAADVDTKRYAGGVVYTLTQGLTLRGSVQFTDSDVDAAADVDATTVLGGVQFNF